MLFFGTKRWGLTPPRWAGISNLPAADFPDASVRAAIPRGLPLRCTQHPGDALILPPRWGHTTVNEGFGIGVSILWWDAWNWPRPTLRSRGGGRRSAETRSDRHLANGVPRKASRGAGNLG